MVLTTEKVRPKINRFALERGLAELQYVPGVAHMAPHLSEFLATRDDTSVAQMRPHLLAREWKSEITDALRLCLYATKAGLLNLNWTMLCPNCRIGKSETGSLRDLQEKVHCDLCGIEYGVNFDRFVELRFHVHPAIRTAQASTYCIGGPAITPHVWVQKIVPPGETVGVPFLPSRAAMRVRVLRQNFVASFEAGAGDAAVPLVLMPGGWSRAVYPLPQDGEELCVVNQSGEEIVVALEQVAWDDDAVTASQVTTMQEFRDLFSSEVLAPGHQVGVESLTVFFSDLRNSTTLYEHAGDAPAYARVRQHFQYLRERITAHGGGVIKTIGDAAMATFYAPEDALRAALAIQGEIDELNAGCAPGQQILLRIGLHHGPAIAATSNDRLDYFGATVNIAARVESASLGGDIVLTSACLAQPQVREILRELEENGKGEVKAFQAQLKGIAEVLTLHRVVLSADQPAQTALEAAEAERRRTERRAVERRKLEI